MKILNKEKVFDILPKVNLLLVLSVIGLTICLYLNTSRSQQSFSRPRILRTSSSRDIRQRTPQKIPVFDEGIFKERMLFGSISEEKKPAQEETTIELLGLVSMGDKNAAMLRDTRENKEYYCLGGEIIGAFTVKQILKDRVILESEGEIMELRQ